MCERVATDNSKVKIQNHIYPDTVRKFRIKNNVLIGHELPMSREPINVSEVLLKIMKSNPNCIGEINATTDEKYTFADMSERSIKCALWLKKQGVKPGDIIGLCCDNNMNEILIMLGTMYIGAISNTWDTLSPLMARQVLSIVSPTIIFANSSTAINLTEAAKELGINPKIVVLGKLTGYTSFDEILKDHNAREIIEFKCARIGKPDDVALIVPSSGTTGIPKATEISHFSLRNCLPPEKIAELEGHICIWAPTLRWHYGVQLAFQVILACATRIVVPEYFDDTVYCEYIEKYKVTWYSTDPCMIIKSLKTNLFDKLQLLSLKEMSVSGSPFGKEFHKAASDHLPHALILNGYGTTDSGGDISVQIKGCKLGSIGFVAPNVQIKIVDVKTGKILGVNETGELRIKLPCMMNRYYKNPEATKQAFDSDGWLCTGDLGYYDEDGEIFLIDRLSEFLLFRSVTISPAEIEYVLATHPAVLEVAVIGIPHEVNEQHPMAIVSLVPGKTVTGEELMTLVEENMPDFYRLRAGVKILDRLPRTSTGKIAKKELREMFIINAN